MNLLLLGVLGYVLAQVVIGILASRKISSEDDYLLAGRTLGPGLATFSLFATWFGAETCINSAGQVYADGLSGGAAEPFAYGLCVLFMGLVFATRLWRRGITTIADLFRQRYSPGVEKVVIFVSVLGSILWAAAQIRAFGHILDNLSEWGLRNCMIVATIAVLAYTVTGGLRADVVTDLIQGIVIILGLGVLVWVVGAHLGGFREAWASVPVERLNPFGGTLPVLERIETWVVPIFGSVMAQELISRVLACRSPNVARQAAVSGGSLYLLVGLMPVGLGLLGLQLLPGLDDPEQFLPELARQHLAPVLYVIFVGALVSAILSTVDSTLLAGAAVLAHNLVIPAVRGMSDRDKVLANRIGVLVCGVAALLLALSSDSIHSLIEASSAIGGGGLFVLFAVGQFTTVGGRASAYAALIASAATWMFMSWVMKSNWSYTASLLVAAAAYFVVAALSRKSSGRPGGS